MPPSNTEDSALISDNSATELWNLEVDLKLNLELGQLLHIIEVDEFATPLKVVHTFGAGVALLQDEGVLKQLTELRLDVHLLVISDFAG